MNHVYYTTYCRLDGLISGVILATIQLFRPGWWMKLTSRGNALLLAGLLVTGAAIWMFQGDYPSPEAAKGILFGFPVLALGFGSLVAAAASSNGLLRMHVPGAQLLATLAFSLYLTHKEVAHLDRAWLPWLESESGWRAAGVYAISCLAGSALLYVCVERPFLSLRDRHLKVQSSGFASSDATLDPAL